MEEQKLIKAFSSLLEEEHETKTPRTSVARRWGSRKGRRGEKRGKTGWGRVKEEEVRKLRKGEDEEERRTWKEGSGRRGGRRK